MAPRLDLLNRSLRFYERKKKQRDFAGRNIDAAYGPVSARYYHDFWKKAAQAVGAEIEKISDSDFHRIQKGDRWTFVKRHMVMLDNYLGRLIVDNKYVTQQILAEHGWQAPRNLVFYPFALAPAHRFMDDLGKSVVVKPKSLSGGRGITTNIDGHMRLIRASAWASTFAHSLIVEEHVEGDSYRLLFLAGELIDAVRRDPPTVIGDGTRSIRDLMRHENTERLNGPSATSLIPLTIDLECKYTLQRQGLTLNSVPAMHKPVQVKSVVNQNASRENHPVRSGIHPSFIELGRRFASFLNLKLFGMDIITREIGVSLQESGGVLLELNIPPGLHYHDLVSDESIKAPVGELILEAIFTRSEQLWCGGLA